MTRKTTGPGPLPDPGPSVKSASSSTKRSANPLEIWVTGDLHVMTAKALEALPWVNQGRPFIFRCGTGYVRLRTDFDRPLLEPLIEKNLRQVMAEHVRWWWRDRYGSKAVSPPPAVMTNMLASPAWPVPYLERLVVVPVLGPDGALQVTPGYHPASRTLYSPPPGFQVPPVSDQPSAAEVKAARLLVADLLDGFPFVSEADRAHTVAAILLPFVRVMIDGPTPLHLVSAPVRGTGKTLLARVICFLAVGAEVPVQTQAKNEEEWRKKVGAILSTGPVIVFFDNLLGFVGSAALAAVLTSTEWEDRLLGNNDQVIRFANKALWIFTANNMRLADEMVRRTVPLRLDAVCEKPYERPRSEFRHPDLMGWVRQTHPNLVWAALTLCRAWVAAGRPLGERTIGSFENWSQVMGGILQVAGIAGFLENITEFHTESDAQTEGWRDLFTRLHTAFPFSSFGAKDAVKVYGQGDDFLNLGYSDFSARSEETRLGLRLQERRDNIYAGLRLEHAGKSQGGNRWRLIPVEGRGNAK